MNGQTGQIYGEVPLDRSGSGGQWSHRRNYPDPALIGRLFYLKPCPTGPVWVLQAHMV